MTMPSKSSLYSSRERVELDPIEIKQRIVEHVRTYSAEHGFGPTINELSNALGLKSKSTTQKFVVQLIAEHRLARSDCRCRSLRVLP